jgi:hypothetical protein
VLTQFNAARAAELDLPPLKISGSRAAAASASTASWCDHQGSMRHENIRCSWSFMAGRMACGATSSSFAGTTTCWQHPVTCCCSLTTLARPGLARSSRVPHPGRSAQGTG